MKRLVLILLVPGMALTAGAQSNSASVPANAVQAPTAMEKSLAQQQAAIDAFQESVKVGSIAAQQQSVLSQLQPLQAKPVQASASPVDKASAEFFSTPWPGSLPLAVPNVQMPYVSCDPLDGREVNKLVETAATKHELDSTLLKSVMKQESAFKPCALSVAGAMGLMQIMPETAQMLHLDDPFDPAKNVDAGAKFLKTMLDRFGGDVAMALAAYNAGPTTVDRAGGIPPIAETLQYVSNILGDLPIAY